MFVHRKLGDGDIYFVDNRNDRAENVDATFRVDGKAPELWDAASGEAQPASYSIANGRTTVPLHLEPYGTTFVVFREPAKSASRTLPEPKETVVAGVDDALNKDWTVNFEPNRGAPETAQFDRLISWSESPDQGVKYFSGSATYSKTIEIPASAFTPGSASLARSGRRGEYRRRRRERQVPGDRVEDAVPDRPDQCARAGQQPDCGASDESCGSTA